MMVESGPPADVRDRASDHAPDPVPSLDRLLAGMLRASGHGTRALAWSPDAKERLYRRMFPEPAPAAAPGDASVLP